MADDRSKQLELARRVGVEDPEQMSPAALRKAIDDAPATAEQKDFVTALLKYQKLPMPDAELTFGRASGILDHLAPLVNEGVLMRMGWTEGCIIAWKGDYYQLITIHSTKMVTLARVELVRDPSGGRARVEPTAEQRTVRHPFTLHEDDAVKVDLNTVEL